MIYYLNMDPVILYGGWCPSHCRRRRHPCSRDLLVIDYPESEVQYTMQQTRPVGRQATSPQDIGY